MYGGTQAERKKKEEEAAKKAARKAAEKAKKEDKKRQKFASSAETNGAKPEALEERSVEATAVSGAGSVDVGKDAVDGVTDG